MWQGLAILLGLSLVTLMIITLLTKPEDKEVLKNFYDRCRPPGLWGGVTAVRTEQQKTPGRQSAHSRMIINAFLGILCSLGLVLATNALFTLAYGVLIFGVLLSLLTGYLLIRRLKKNTI